jgi:hypothetical protein
LARLPDREFPGKVTRIADALQPGTRTLLTEIDIPNPDSALSPGIYCTIGGLRRAIPFLLVGSDAWRKSSTLYGTKRSCRHAYCLDKPGKRGLARDRRAAAPERCPPRRGPQTADFRKIENPGGGTPGFSESGDRRCGGIGSPRLSNNTAR